MTKPAKSKKLSEAERLKGLLRERHSDAEWIFFTELATSGTEHSRYIDAFAMNLWQSNKFRRIAYEIKVSRSDLMGELDKHPEKRDAAMELSNQFFYVVPTGLVEKKEIPEGCGLIEAHKSGLRTKVAAKLRKVEPVSMPFLARMLMHKRGYGTTPVPCFKYAGRDMTEEEFRKLVVSSMSATMELEIDKKVDIGVKRWKIDNQVSEVIKYLRGETGHEWSTMDVRDLKKWIDGIRKGIPIEDLRWLTHDMKSVQERLSGILEKIPKEEEQDHDDDEDETKGEADPVPDGDGTGDPERDENPNEENPEPTAP